MSMAHPASFRRYLKERFVDRLPQPIGQFHYIDAEQDPEAECARLNRLIGEATIDVAFVGIGENGHLAFNDPPADFETEEPYLMVELDEACRRQQLGEGWFGSLAEVPDRAVSMSVRQIMKARAVICTIRVLLQDRSGHFGRYRPCDGSLHRFRLARIRHIAAFSSTRSRPPDWRVDRSADVRPRRWAAEG